jgi:hypothetical protein
MTYVNSILSRAQNGKLKGAVVAIFHFRDPNIAFVSD